MALRSFHSPLFLEALDRHHLTPLYFLGPHYFQLCDQDSSRYFELKTREYDQAHRHRRLARWLPELRRFTVRTETTDLRFRESIEASLFQAPVARVVAYAALMDVLRRLPGMGPLAAWWENRADRQAVHRETLQAQGVRGVLTPGFGSYGFEFEGFFAREAKSLGLKVVAAITNYDNIVNRGFRGFLPDKVAVWSRLMADEAMHLQKIPASRIDITGPAQFDHLFQPLSLSREDYLQSLGLDPQRKTILFAGGVNITRYFEIYRLFLDSPAFGAVSRPNLIIRPYPHSKLLSSPGWQVLEKLFSQKERVYISNPMSTSADNLLASDLKRDLAWGQDADDLYYLLKFSEVMVNIFSTISLEAAICDLPTIHLGYDLYTFGHSFDMTTAFQQRQTHNRRELRLQAARIAQDEADLVKQLDLYLEDPSRDREARHAYALSECGYLDGKSSQRLAALLESCLGKEPGNA
jgi:hypothetical protein